MRNCALCFAVVLIACASGCQYKPPPKPDISGNSLGFKGVLHSPGTLAGVPGGHWYIEPLPEDKHRAERKPLPVDVTGVLDQAKALDGKRVKMYTRIPKQKELQSEQHVLYVTSLTAE
jgi:hypothetical protein